MMALNKIIFEDGDRFIIYRSIDAKIFKIKDRGMKSLARLYEINDEDFKLISYLQKDLELAEDIG